MKCVAGTTPEAYVASIPCPQCGMSLKVKPEHAGKLVSCGKCGNRFRAALPSSLVSTPTQTPAGEDNRSAQVLEEHRRQASEDARFIRRLLSGAVLAVAAGVLGLGACLLLRDTWERDNARLLASLKSDADEALVANDWRTAFVKCELILRTAGERPLKDPKLRALRESARKGKETAWCRMKDAREAREKEEPKARAQRAEEALKSARDGAAQRLAAERSKAEEAERGATEAEKAQRAGEEEAQAAEAARKAADTEAAGLKSELADLRAKRVAELREKALLCGMPLNAPLAAPPEPGPAPVLPDRPSHPRLLPVDWPAIIYGDKESIFACLQYLYNHFGDMSKAIDFMAKIPAKTGQEDFREKCRKDNAKYEEMDRKYEQQAATFEARKTEYDAKKAAKDSFLKGASSLRAAAEVWLDVLPKLGSQTARGQMQTMIERDFPVKMPSLFDYREREVDAALSRKLCERVATLGPAEFAKWKLALDKAASPISEWSLALALANAAPLYDDGGRYLPERGAKILARVQALTGKHVDLWMQQFGLAGPCRDDAALSIALQDGFFEGERFNEEEFNSALGGVRSPAPR